MSLFGEIVRELITEGADVKLVNDAINNTYEVRINYKGEDGEHTGERLIQPVAYGYTMKGFPAIRAFQPQGDTSSRIPSWKLFRLDRIESWNPMKDQVFSEPPGFNQMVLGKFNPNGDDSMSQVNNIAKFGNERNVPQQPSPEMKTGATTKADAANGGRIERNPHQEPADTKQNQGTVDTTEGPVTKQDIKALSGEENPGVDRLKDKFADQDYLAKAMRDAEYGDEENNEEDIENNG